MVCVFLRVERVADGLNDQMIIRTALDLGDGCSDRGMCFQGGWNFQVHSANPHGAYFLGTSRVDRLCYMALSTLPSPKRSFQAVIGM